MCSKISIIINYFHVNQVNKLYDVILAMHGRKCASIQYNKIHIIFNESIFK